MRPLLYSVGIKAPRSDSGSWGKSLMRRSSRPLSRPSTRHFKSEGTQVRQMFTQSCTGDHTPMLSTDAGSMFSIYCMHHNDDRILCSEQRSLKHTPWHSPTYIQNVVGRCATKVERALPTR